MQGDRSTRQPLRPGDVVEVRSPIEILATLDPSGETSAVPFMPEMLQFVGRRFTVSKRVEKICDTIKITGSRRMRDTVLLDDVRCDGSGHGGCQAECRIYWKEEWLVKVDPASASTKPTAQQPEELEHLTQSNTHAKDAPTDGPEVFRCQATEAFRATEPIPSVVSPGQYVREISCGNVGVGTFLEVAARAISWKVGVTLGMNVGSMLRVPVVEGAARTPEPPTAPPLQPGEWVEVRSAEEIGRTLDAKGTNRGLIFSPTEMLPACGKKFRVKRRVDKLIDEKTGRMINIKNDCIVLENIVCGGDRSPGRWFCPRELYPYWREAWLKRTDPPGQTLRQPAHQLAGAK
jgi:hypothetical protein